MPSSKQVVEWIAKPSTGSSFANSGRVAFRYFNYGFVQQCPILIHTEGYCTTSIVSEELSLC